VEQYPEAEQHNRYQKQTRFRIADFDVRQRAYCPDINNKWDRNESPQWTLSWQFPPATGAEYGAAIPKPTCELMD
jgi:hypothetical protein